MGNKFTPAHKFCLFASFQPNKLNKYSKTKGILNNKFRPKKTFKTTIIKLYNTLTVPALLYGSENWTIKARETRRITATGVKYMRKTAGYIWTDCKTNTEIAKELNITRVLDKIQECRKEFLQHRMPFNRLPQIIK
jgi:hypothetical protein